MNTLTFMQTFVQTQFKGSSKDIEPQVKQHEARTSNKLSNVSARLKKSVVLFFKKLVHHIVSFSLI